MPAVCHRKFDKTDHTQTIGATKRKEIKKKTPKCLLSLHVACGVCNEVWCRPYPTASKYSSPRMNGLVKLVGLSRVQLEIRAPKTYPETWDTCMCVLARTVTDSGGPAQSISGHAKKQSDTKHWVRHQQQETMERKWWLEILRRSLLAVSCITKGRPVVLHDAPGAVCCGCA